MQSDKRPLSPAEQFVYRYLRGGESAVRIAHKLHMHPATVQEYASRILAKGWEIKNPEEPERNDKVMRKQYTKLSGEDKERLREYRRTHTTEQTAEAFGTSTQTVRNICKQAPSEPVAAFRGMRQETAPPEVLAAAHRAVRELQEEMDAIRRRMDAVVEWLREEGDVT